MKARTRFSRLVLAPAPVVLALLAAACGSSDEPARPSSASAAPVAWPEAIPASIAHRDPGLGTPSFVWINRSGLPRASSALEAATATVRGLAKTYELDTRALASIGQPVVHDVGSGPIVTRFTQTVDGIDVFRGGLNLMMTRAFEPVASSGLVAKALKGREKPFAIDHRAALDVAASRAPDKARLRGAFSEVASKNGYTRFAAPGLSQPAMVKKVFFPEAEGLVPAYYVNMMFARGGAWSFVVAADDGRELFRHDLVKQDFSYQVYADPTTKIPYDGPMGNGYVPHPTGKPDGFRPPVGPSTLVKLNNFPFSKNDPWLLPGATNTLGLNVRAYVDLEEPDGYSKNTNDFVGVTTADGVFGAVYDLTKSPSSNPNASTTQLFYTMNFMHDFYYDVGFDEKSGNHQEQNYGRGGLEGDPLYAEAQDFGGRNNADAATPPDGGSARVQMYVWSGISAAKLTVSAPQSLAGAKNTQIASFGKDSFLTTGNVVVGDDGSGADGKDACEPLDASIAGKIVLVHRGTCSFVQKALNVQAAGGIGVIVSNVASSAMPEQPPYMGGTSSQVTIPILSVALADGQALEAAAATGATAVTVEMERKLQTDLDGSLDLSVVAHEWGHTLSNRLIGNGDGMTSNQSGGLGEGWSDFVAMTVTVRGDDPAGYAGTYTNGGYATGGIADDYFGTRRVPYSIDMTKNALTFKHVQNGVALPVGPPTSFGEDGSFNAEVHSAGEVWATMLWECYAALLKSGRYSFDETQKRMKQYLVAGMKVTPIEPTFLEARDGLLAATLAADAKDYADFWRAFAKRGAGVGAEGPGKDSADNVGVKESFEVRNHVAVGVGKLSDDTISCDHDGILDPFEVGSVELDLRNDGVEALTGATVEIQPKSADVKLVGFEPVKLAPLAPFASQKITVPISITSLASNVPIELNVVVKDAALGDTKSQTVVLPARYASDEAPESSTIDTVETNGTVWNSKGADKLAKPFARVRTQTTGWWSVSDQPVPSDQRLTSPAFTIDGSAFTLSFKHRWSFRFSTRRMVDVDGGVVEISTDGGKTFEDIGKYGTADYNSTVDASRGDNPLKGRKAYANKSMGYPDQWITSSIPVELGTHPESVIVRFRAGMSTGFSGAPGWDIDDISLEGISSKPFPSYVPQQDACDEAGPTVPAFAALTVESKAPVTLTGTGTHPENKPLTFLWAQEAGGFVETKIDGPNLSFTAPEAKEGTPLKLVFVLRAHDGALLSAPGKVEVTVLPDPTIHDSLGGGCDCRSTSSPTSRTSPYAALGLGALALGFLAARRRK